MVPQFDTETWNAQVLNQPTISDLGLPCIYCIYAF